LSSLQPAVVQYAQFGIAVKTQAPAAVQASQVHGLPSSQGVALPQAPVEQDGRTVNWHAPLAGSQPSLVHALSSTQGTATDTH
jgi:hypothetical protein